MFMEENLVFRYVPKNKQEEMAVTLNLFVFLGFVLKKKSWIEYFICILNFINDWLLLHEIAITGTHIVHTRLPQLGEISSIFVYPKYRSLIKVGKSQKPFLLPSILPKLQWKTVIIVELSSNMGQIKNSATLLY